jgi:hypothetical protein
MTTSSSNWVGDESNRQIVENAHVVLSKVKHERYADKQKKYRLEKIRDMPLTYREVLIEGDPTTINISHDEVFDEEEVLEEINFEELNVKEAES